MVVRIVVVEEAVVQSEEVFSIVRTISSTDFARFQFFFESHHSSAHL